METSVLKRGSQLKAKSKSRTSNRPALKRKKKKSFEDKLVTRVVFRTAYALCVLFLFQYVLTHFVFDLNRIIATTVHAKELSLGMRSRVGMPVRIKIPSISVNATIRNVGRLADGSMGVPKLPRETAWYSMGPRPGEVGSAVIAGHVDWWYGATAVFTKLHTLKEGDVISVEDDKGVTTSFVVRGMREYSLKDDAKGVFVAFDGKSHLNLVTCSGIWDRVTQKYTKRLVVFTDKVTEKK